MTALHTPAGEAPGRIPSGRGSHIAVGAVPEGEPGVKGTALASLASCPCGTALRAALDPGTSLRLGAVKGRAAPCSTPASHQKPDQPDKERPMTNPRPLAITTTSGYRYGLLPACCACGQAIDPEGDYHLLYAVEGLRTVIDAAHVTRWSGPATSTTTPPARTPSTSCGTTSSPCSGPAGPSGSPTTDLVPARRGSAFWRAAPDAHRRRHLARWALRGRSSHTTMSPRLPVDRPRRVGRAAGRDAHPRPRRPASVLSHPTGSPGRAAGVSFLSGPGRPWSI